MLLCSRRWESIWLVRVEGVEGEVEVVVVISAWRRTSCRRTA